MSCPLLLDSASYHPDTEDLLQNRDAREYWLQCFEDATEKVYITLQYSYHAKENLASDKIVKIEFNANLDLPVLGFSPFYNI